MSHRQRRVVFGDCTRPNDHGVSFSAELMHVLARLRTRDPLRISCRRCNASVNCLRRLQNNERPLVDVVGDILLVESPCLLAEDADFHVNTDSPESGSALSIDERVGIFGREYHALDACQGNGFRAWACPPLVTARLERDIESSASRLVPRFLERDNLRVVGPGPAMVPLADHLPTFNDYRADHGIGRCRTPAFDRQLKGPSHVFYVRLSGHQKTP
jgi:hypothetical protein